MEVEGRDSSIPEAPLSISRLVELPKLSLHGRMNAPHLDTSHNQRMAKAMRLGHQRVRWLQTWFLVGLFGLDLWTKWPSHTLGTMLTVNTAVGLDPAWLTAVGQWLVSR